MMDNLDHFCFFLIGIILFIFVGFESLFFKNKYGIIAIDFLTMKESIFSLFFVHNIINQHVFIIEDNSNYKQKSVVLERKYIKLSLIEILK